MQQGSGTQRLEILRAQLEGFGHFTSQGGNPFSVSMWVEFELICFARESAKDFAFEIISDICLGGWHHHFLVSRVCSIWRASAFCESTDRARFSSATARIENPRLRYSPASITRYEALAGSNLMASCNSAS